MLSGLIESEFFPKWGDALWVWLKSDGVNLEQVAEWLAIFLPPLSSEHRLTMMKSRYSWWKSYFPEDVVALSGVSRGFRKGLDLMNQAMALGEDVKYRYVPLSSLVSVQVPILTDHSHSRADSRNPISSPNNPLLHLLASPLPLPPFPPPLQSRPRSLSDQSSKIYVPLRISSSSRLDALHQKVRICSEYQKMSMAKVVYCVISKMMSVGLFRRVEKVRQNRLGSRK